MSEKYSIRINKFLSETGYCSRREADKYLTENRITINDKPAQIGAQVFPEDVVKIDGDVLLVPKKEKLIYIALHKPAGVVCTTDVKKEKNNIIDYIGHEQRIFPIGRLDKDSEGLIFLTNDGDIVNKILRSENQHDKEYIVTVNKSINSAFINEMSAGTIRILGTQVKKCKVEFINKRQFSIVLTQGLNRQIRRMTEALGYKVVSLTRVRIMNIKLDMPVGKWRNFKEHELEALQSLLASSSTKSQKAAPKKPKKPATKYHQRSTATKSTRSNSKPGSPQKNKGKVQNQKSKSARSSSGRGKR